MMPLHVHGMHVACNLNSLIEAEGPFKVTASHGHCKSGKISETVHERETLLM